MSLAPSRGLAGLLACLVCACHPGPGEDDDTGSDETTGAAGKVVLTPAFLNPATGSFRVASDQTEPEVLTVRNIVPGVTQVLIDGYSLGTLDGPNPIGTLDDDTLTLHIQGALLAGNHSIQLLTSSPQGPLYSVELDMEIVAPKAMVAPTWSVTQDPTLVATGTHLFATGADLGGLLALLGPGEPDPQLTLYRADASGWSTADPIVLPLEGHVLQAMSFAPAVSALAALEPGAAAPRRARVAYSLGLPGAAIATRDIQIDPSPIVLDPVIAFDLAAALGDTQLEYAAFGRPVVLGNTLVAELHAAADAEQPHPGDHRLVASFWRGEDLGWTAPQQIGTATPSDLDALGPAPVLTDLAMHASTTLSVRFGGAFPALLDLRDTGAISLTSPALTGPLDVTGDISLATILGGFGGRTVAAVDRHGRVSLSLLETTNGGPPRQISPNPSTLPLAPATGSLAAGVGLGFPFFLIPYGDAAPVHLVTSDGDRSYTQALADLHCDALALALTLAGNAPQQAALPLACLKDGELRLATLHIEPSPP